VIQAEDVFSRKVLNISTMTKESKADHYRFELVLDHASRFTSKGKGTERDISVPFA